MKVRVGDLVLLLLASVLLSLAGLLLAGPRGGAPDPSLEVTRGWSAVGYLVPYLMIFAVEPLERHYGRFRRRRREL